MAANVTYVTDDNLPSNNSLLIIDFVNITDEGKPAANSDRIFGHYTNY